MKKIMIPFLALIVLIGSSAFAISYQTQNQKILDPIWWDFTGNPASQQDKEDPEMYLPDPDNSEDCTTGNDLCEILASPQIGNEDYPDLSTEITTARTFRN